VAIGTVQPPQVDGRQLVDAECPQILLDAGPELGRLLPREPATGAVPPRADLRHQGQVGRVGVQGLMDQVIGHVGPVVLRRVNVVDPELDGPS
jgi:hypothetical protein